jgi:CDP-diacylglycerol--glycerol-3-phosphate 3-phosphatidyltransferase
MDAEEFRRRWAVLHGGAAVTGVVGGWLSVSRALAMPLARARVAPSAVTVAALVTGLLAVVPAAARGRWALLAAALVGVSGVLDGLDGSVAVLQGRASRWGFVLDSVCDRVAEAGFAAALYAAGAPGWLVVVSAATGWLQEYLRARAAAAGMTGIEVVTVSERPTRIAVAAMFLLGAGVYPPAGATWAAAGAAVGLTAGLVGLWQLLAAVRRVVREGVPEMPR